MCTSAVEISPRRRGPFFSIEGKVVGSDVDKSGRSIFFILQKDLLGKGWQSKVFFFRTFTREIVLFDVCRYAFVSYFWHAQLFGM